MEKGAIYRQRAEQVRRLAAEALTDGERTTLLEIASTWDKLARQRDQDEPPGKPESKPGKKR